MALRNIMPWRRRPVRESIFESIGSAVEALEGRRHVTELRLEERPGELVATARLPGMSRDDIRIDVTERTLTVYGCARSEERRKHGIKRVETSFTRRITLPAAVRVEGVSASFKNDRLEVRLPRLEEKPAKRVDIG